MALRHGSLDQYVHYWYSRQSDTQYQLNSDFKPNTSDTYIAISGLNQDEHRENFIRILKEKGANFLYISPPAINTNYRDEPARNVLMIFEFEEVNDE